jgi:glutamine amidotransferase
MYVLRKGAKMSEPRSRSGKVVIIDYGMGNLYNVQRACDFVGLSAEISSDPVDIASADGAILPGVGAFRDAMAVLHSTGLAEAIKQLVADDKPLLGICLGLQLLMSESTEFGTHKGLDIIQGTVDRLAGSASGEFVAKVPQVGWNQIHAVERGDWDDSLLGTISSGAFVYFMHSYCVRETIAENVLSMTEYGDEQFCSAVRTGSVTAVQFHPELSGSLGLGIYENFATMVRDK